VKRGENTCPFCGNDIAHVNAPVAKLVIGRLSRAALFAAGAAGLALATADCGSDSTPIPLYGGPPGCCEAVGTEDAGVEDASVDAATWALPEAAGYGDATGDTLIGDASGDAPVGDASGDALDGNSMSPADAASADAAEEAVVVCGACPAYGGPPNPPCCP
jgi:hypothetical protein